MFLSCGRLNNIRITYESHKNNICVTAADVLELCADAKKK